MARFLGVIGIVGLCWFTAIATAEPLPGTKPLDAEGDLAEKMVEGIVQYLQQATAGSVTSRAAAWRLDHSSVAAYAKSVEPNRTRLRKILGMVEPRVPFDDIELVATLSRKAQIGTGDGYNILAVRWPVYEDLHAEGLLLEPVAAPKACVVALPDADATPEQLVGLSSGIPESAQFARRLAENGCRVLVPDLVDRSDTWSGNSKLGISTNIPHREYLYRMAYELGRHLIGSEVQKILAAVDWYTRDPNHPPIGVVGYGEGGLLAFYAGALDPRIQTTLVAGYFGPRENLWQEPIYRNVWSLLREFGDAEISLLFGPKRTLVVEACPMPKVDGPPPPKNNRDLAAPGKLTTPDARAVESEWKRIETLGGRFPRELIQHTEQKTAELVDRFLPAEEGKKLRPLGKKPLWDGPEIDPTLRRKRQFDQHVQHLQRVLRECEQVRDRFFWSKLDVKQSDTWSRQCQPLREYFSDEVLGRLPAPSVEMNPRSRLVHDEAKWKGYEVVLDLYPEVFAYGILLVPKDLKEGERRPVVVCQHGLEGRPRHVIEVEKQPAYNQFAARLAERGYVVFAPQNPYIFNHKFRVIQRYANPLKLSLFSFIVRQHERILDWLASLPFVDGDRIGLYGLSYGGKTAMRVPAVLPRYALSICSADFNEWVLKNATHNHRFSYQFTKEYEMPEFDLGSTFNYAEMAALIAPRPFMVERGHDDGVGTDEFVSYEYAKVRRLYAKLKIPERQEIEFFDKGHEIHGKGTFEFLDRHLKWKPK